jgi:hypothetical protein
MAGGFQHEWKSENGGDLMTVLVPQPYYLLDTTAIDYDYPAFDASEVFTSVPAYRVYGHYIYERLTEGVPPSGDEWDNTTIYSLGDTLYYTPTTTNYTFTSESLVLDNPADDTTHYTDQGNYAAVGYWHTDTTWYVGDIVAYEKYGVTRYYYCVVEHTTINDIYIPYYTSDPDGLVYLWAKIEYWGGTTFYLSTSDIPYVHYETNLYQVTTSVTAQAPDVDTENWLAAASATPDVDTENWSLVGPANTLKMFDSFSTTQTVGNNGPITVVVQAQEIDGIYLGNLLADTVTINVYDADTDELLETHTEDLQYECENWLEYFSGMWIERLSRNMTYFRTTMNDDVVISITIDYGENTSAACGVAVFGSAKNIGISIWSFSRGGMDYTGVELNADGSTTAVPGLNIPIIDIECIADTLITDRVAHDLDGLKGQPAAIIGDEEDAYRAVNLFGILKKHTITGKPSKANISLEFNGLT